MKAYREKFIRENFRNVIILILVGLFFIYLIDRRLRWDAVVYLFIILGLALPRDYYKLMPARLYGTMDRAFMPRFFRNHASVQTLDIVFIFIILMAISLTQYIGNIALKLDSSKSILGFYILLYLSRFIMYFVTSVFDIIFKRQNGS